MKRKLQVGRGKRKLGRQGGGEAPGIERRQSLASMINGEKERIREITAVDLLEDLGH